MMLFHYLKFFLFHIIGLLAFSAAILGGQWAVYGLAAILITYCIGDIVLGHDTSTPEYKNPNILTYQLWVALPLLSLMMFGAVWTVSPTDVLGFGAAVNQLISLTPFEYDVLAVRDATGFVGHFVTFVIAGLMIGLIGTITAHELTHRTWDPTSMFIGRWLLAFSFDTIFSIEHVYGHHRYVSTSVDPATAPRGRNVYFHVIASTIKGNISAWNIEKERLGKRGKNALSFGNGVIRGHLMSVFLCTLAFLMGGINAMLFFIACGLWGKALLEIVNYMEHYGMVRDPEVPVQPRHSWNSTNRISSWSMFNLNRHSHHHADGTVPYQDLRPYPDAPQMITGYLGTIILTMIPPLWHHLMTPKVLEWDKNYASKDELALAKTANEKSGIKAFVEASNSPLYQGVAEAQNTQQAHAAA